MSSNPLLDGPVPMSPPPPPSPEDVVSFAIKQAKAEITAKQAKKEAEQNRVHDNIENLLKGLSKLWAESNQKFKYEIREQTESTLKVTTNLKGMFGVITVNGNSKFFRNSVGVGKGLKKDYIFEVNTVLASATKKAVKQGLVRP